MWGDHPHNNNNKNTNTDLTLFATLSAISTYVYLTLSFFQMLTQDSHSSSSLISCAQFSSPAQHTFLGYLTTHLPPYFKKKREKLFSSLLFSTSHLYFCLHSCFPPSLPLKLESTDGIKLCMVTFSGSVST